VSENVSEPSAEPSEPTVESSVEPSEPVAEPSEPVNESAADPAVEPTAPAKKHRRRGRIAAIAGSALLAAAVIAGVGWTVVTVHGADRDAGAAKWQFPQKKSAPAEKAASPSGLHGMLQAYGDGWKPGPDLGQFAADTELSGAQATAMRKEAIRNLPRTERRQLEKLIDKQHIEGMAMRSYVRETGGSFATDTAVSVDVELSRMKNRAAVRNISTSQNALLRGLGVFRKGPKIKGYKDAACFLPPKTSGGGLESMLCSAYRGDVLVSVAAYGIKPFNAQSVAELLKDQLDRIAEPGEAV
jgi:hypothetical protein